jgi:hypothetical protein
MLVRSIERQERRQWAIEDADKVIHKADLRAAIRTCSQGTRDLLSHGVLPYGASLVGAGVANGAPARSPPVLRFWSRRFNAQAASNCLRFDTSTSRRHASVVQYAVLLMSDIWLTPEKMELHDSKAIFVRLSSGGKVAASETLSHPIECSRKHMPLTSC